MSVSNEAPVCTLELDSFVVTVISIIVSFTGFLYSKMCFLMSKLLYFYTGVEADLNEENSHARPCLHISLAVSYVIYRVRKMFMIH